LGAELGVGALAHRGGRQNQSRGRIEEPTERILYPNLLFGRSGPVKACEKVSRTPGNTK
jgi:hypothetical protein